MLLPPVIIDIKIIILIISGFGGGISVGTASGTSGAFLIPSLTVFIGYRIHEAIGTSLLVDCIIGGVAGLIFLKNGNVDIRSGLLLAIVGVIGAFLGSKFTSGASPFGLSIFIGLFLIIIGLDFIMTGIKRNVKFIEERINLKFFKNNKIFSFVIFGFIIGLASGFSGIGGGGMIALVLIFILGYDIHTAIGTSLIMMFFIAGSGAIGHYFYNEVVIDIALIASFGAIIGALCGSIVANKVDENKLGRLIGIILLALGIVLLYNIFYLK